MDSKSTGFKAIAHFGAEGKDLCPCFLSVKGDGFHFTYNMANTRLYGSGEEHLAYQQCMRVNEHLKKFGHSLYGKVRIVSVYMDAGIDPMEEKA